MQHFNECLGQVSASTSTIPDYTLSQVRSECFHNSQRGVNENEKALRSKLTADSLRIF